MNRAYISRIHMVSTLARIQMLPKCIETFVRDRAAKQVNKQIELFHWTVRVLS
jgi:hypothetical protein